ncbi:MAG: hypothetical protein WAM53_07705 [Terrimicrobiaceae bacterium]
MFPPFRHRSEIQPKNPWTRSHRKGEGLLTEFWAQVWNPPDDLDTIDRLCTEDSVVTNGGIDIVGQESANPRFSSAVSELKRPAETEAI